MDALQDEVESLEAILMEDVKIKRNSQSGVAEVIETTIFPVVGEDAEQQYVCVTLQVLPTPGYPDVSPDFKLLRPRGLDDVLLDAIKTACLGKLQESVGFPVVFDLIEVVREHLTGSNLPSGQCVICLYGFCDGDEFTRTECYHYLHSYCLARHLNALRRSYHEEFNKLPAWLQKTALPFQALCPVCREPIKDESDSVKCAMPPAELENAPEFQLTQELKDLQERMSKLFLEQKSRGAIIDVEAETSTVISIETEEEMRRRLQRKQDEVDAAAAATAASTFGATEFRYYGVENSSGSSSPETGSVTILSTDVKEAKASGSTNFAPVVEPNQTRLVPEPTNNNYQHYRRHRGGRREHHRNHRHHRERERDRDRDNERNEQNNATSGTSAAVVSSAQNASGKQPKQQISSNSHGR